MAQIKKDRIKKGYYTAIRLMTVWGVVTSAALIFFPQVFSQIFIRSRCTSDGSRLSENPGRFTALYVYGDSTTAGAFQGLGKTFPPAVEGVVLNLLRIPMALVLSATALGLNGVWWSISISSILKGIILPAGFLWYCAGI